MRKGLGKEDIIHKSFATTLKRYELFGKLHCSFWTYFPSGESRTAKTGALLKAKGTKTGVADFFFVVEKENFYELTWLEFKTDKGTQSDPQKEFQKKFEDNYFIVRSVEEGLNILKDRSIL